MGTAAGLGTAFAVGAFVIAVVMISCIVALRRALHSEPMQALRADGWGRLRTQSPSTDTACSVSRFEMISATGSVQNAAEPIRSSQFTAQHLWLPASETQRR
jgi:hypothetical protein